MALQGLVKSQAPEYEGLDLGIIGNAAKMRQQNFNQANAAMSDALQTLQTKDYVDDEARAQATARAQNRYEALVKKTQNNLGAALPDVMSSVREVAADPYNLYNKYQMEQVGARNELKAKYGDRAIVLNDPGQQRLTDNIDVEGNVSDPLALKERLTSNVAEASDYTQEAMKLGQWLKPSSIPVGLRRRPGMAQFFQHGNISELSEKDIRDLANDPAVVGAFMANTTAGLDNRETVGYNAEDGTNKFTRRNTSDPRFRNGAAEHIFGALIQKKQRNQTQGYIQDPLEIDAARRAAAGAREEEENKVRLGNARSTVKASSYFNLGKSPEFDEKGGIKSDVIKTYQARSGFGGGGLTYSNDFFGNKTSKKEAKKIEDTINGYAKTYPNLKGKTPKEIWSTVENTVQNQNTLETSPILLDQGQATKHYAPLVGANFFSGTTIVDGESFILGNKNAREDFLEKADLPPSWDAAKAAAKGELRVEYINRVGNPLLGELAGGSYKMTIQPEGKEPIEMEFASPNIQQNNYLKPLNDVYQNLGKEGTSFTVDYADNADLAQINYLNTNSNKIEPVLLVKPKGGEVMYSDPSMEPGSPVQRASGAKLTKLIQDINKAMEDANYSEERKQRTWQRTFGEAYITPAQLASKGQEDVTEADDTTVSPFGKVTGATFKQTEARTK